jgi:hypothetical protein
MGKRRKQEYQEQNRAAKQQSAACKPPALPKIQQNSGYKQQNHYAEW